MLPHSKRRNDDSNSEAEDDQTDFFSDVLTSIRRERIPSSCAAVRRKDEDHNGIRFDGLPLPTIDEPMFGSYHVLLPVRFYDGLKWLLKVPAQGTRAHFDDSASKALTSEALTMIFLRLNTSVPIPNVLTFHASLDNELGCPYILMEHVAGVSLYDCWFGRSKKNRAQHRTNALKDIAAAMAQLNRFSFDYGGFLTFDQDGHPKEIDPMRCVDHKATLDRVFNGDGVDEVQYFQTGPFSTVSSFYTRFLNQQTEPAEPVQRGLWKLLHLFLEWIPEPEDSRKKFVIAHPDFDIQNFIVSPDGHLQAIIDWDGVAAVPRSIGYESYPGWLTRDWDPAMYGWTEEMEHGIEPEGLWEDSPNALAKYRLNYQMLMQSALSEEQKMRTTTPFDENDQVTSGSRTANSLYVENLLIASSNPPCMFPIMRKFVDKINQILGRDPDEELNIFDIGSTIVDERYSEDWIVEIKNGFQAIFQS